ncbi:MAG: citrate lyase acyl carrier protein [Desulfovibrionales bacterium]|nr:citrate lyase acyl carrier protein [Desulfovibrionales bacterium]
MRITTTAFAGSLESNDCMITLHPADSAGVHVAIESIVLEQFGEQIEAVTRAALEEMGVTSAGVQVNDKGALDCTIRARLKTVVARAREKEHA